MAATTGAWLGEGAEEIAGAEWLREFAERYLAGWNSHDPVAVVANATEDVVWSDPALAEPARGRDEVGWFVQASVTAFPDLRFSEAGSPAISDDGRVAYAPWRMTGTNEGPIDPPGFAATGRPVTIEGIDVCQFRDGLIWRYAALYDFSEVGRQLGLMPARGGFAEGALARAQRLRARLPL